MLCRRFSRQYGNAILLVVAARTALSGFLWWLWQGQKLSDMFLFYTGSFLSA